MVKVTLGKNVAAKYNPSPAAIMFMRSFFINEFIIADNSKNINKISPAAHETTGPSLSLAGPRWPPIGADVFAYPTGD